MKTYKAIPGPTLVGVKKGQLSAATNLFADMINAEAASGWEYVGMETLEVSEKSGCALSPKYDNTIIYMLIFCKEI